MVANMGYKETGVGVTTVRMEDGGRLGNDKMGCNKQVWDKTDIVCLEMMMNDVFYQQRQ